MASAKKNAVIKNSALYQAILDNPDHDAVRLVHADWLEENGDTERAEYVRVRIAYKERPDRTVGYPELEERIEALQKKHSRQWLRELPKIDGITWSFGDEEFWFLGEQYGRGFPWRAVASNARAFIDNAARICSAAPIQSLEIGGIAGAKRLASVPQLRNIRELRLRNGRLGPEDAEALARSPYLVKLRELDLFHNQIGDPGATALANSPHLRALEDLHLDKNDITDEGIKALAGSANSRSLRCLTLAWNDFGNAGARALLNSRHLSKELHLYMYECWLVDSDICRRMVKRFGLVGWGQPT